MNDISAKRAEIHAAAAADEKWIKDFSELQRAAQGPVLPPEQQKLLAPWLSPPEDWRDASEYEFCGFIMHHHTDECVSCGAVTHWSETFRAYWRKSDHRTTRMRPMTYVMPQGAGITVFRVPERKIPICTHCLSATREGTAIYLVSDQAAWDEARRREDEARANQRRAGTAARNREYAPVDLNSVPDDI